MFLLSHHVPRLMDTHDWLPRRHGGRWIQPRSTGGGVLSPRPFSTTVLSPLFLSLSLCSSLALPLTVEAQPRLSRVCRADYRNHRRLFSRLFCSMVNSRPADIGALLSETIGAGIDSFSALGRVASGTGLPRGGRVLEFRGRWNWRKLFRGGREMME